MTPKELITYARAVLRVYPCRGVSPKDLAKVIGICDFRWLDPKQALCEEGAKADEMFFLLEGSIKVERVDPNGQKRELTRIAAPALVGHMALIDNSTRSASCAATSMTLVGSLKRRQYVHELNESSARGFALRRILLTALTRQLNGANNRIRSLISQSEPSAADSGKGRQGRSAGTPARAAQGQKADSGNNELEKIAGILDGWKIDESQMATLDKMKVVYDEDAKRNRKAGSGPDPGRK